MSDQPVLRVVVRLLAPFILLFALYVQMHGEYGPGGGFQAGVIFAAAIVAHALVFGPERTLRAVPMGVFTAMVPLGVALYAAVGFATLIAGGGFLDYGAFDSHDPVHGQHIGIVAIELGVGIAVAGTIAAVFFTFALRARA